MGPYTFFNSNIRDEKNYCYRYWFEDMTELPHNINSKRQPIVDTSFENPVLHNMYLDFIEHHGGKRPRNIYILSDFYFGFKSIRQMRKWFNKVEYFCLLSSGFKVEKIKVPDENVVFGTKQCVFVR